MSLYDNLIIKHKTKKTKFYKNLTYKEFYNNLLNFINNIDHLININNKTVGILLPMNIQLLYIIFAFNYLSIPVVIIEPDIDHKKLLFTIKNSKISILFIDTESHNTLFDNPVNSEYLEYIIILNTNINSQKYRIINESLYHNSITLLLFDNLFNKYDIKKKKYIKNNGSFIIFYNENLEINKFDDKIIMEQIKFSINEINIKPGITILSFTNKPIQSILWIYFTSIYLGNSIFFLNDLETIHDLTINRINILYIDNITFLKYKEEFIKLKYIKKFIVVNYNSIYENVLKKYKKGNKILKVLTNNKIFGNYKINRSYYCNKKCKPSKYNFIKYVNQVLNSLLKSINFKTYIVDYLKKQILVIAYKHDKAIDESEYYKEIAKYIYFDKNFRIYFRKIDKQKLTYSTLIYSDYFKCFSEILKYLYPCEYTTAELCSNLIGKLIYKYIFSIFCKLNNLTSITKTSNLDCKSVIKRINSDLNLCINVDSNDLCKVKDFIVNYFKQINYKIIKFPIKPETKYFVTNNFQKIIGIWLKGNLSENFINNSITRIKNKFYLNQTLYSNSIVAYRENSSSTSISHVVGKYKNHQNLISVIYWKSVSSKNINTIFFIFKKLICSEINTILKLFFFDGCSKCIINNLVSPTYKFDYNYFSKDKLIFNLNLLIEFITIIFIFFMKISKSILYPVSLPVNLVILHHQFTERYYFNILNKCNKKGIKLPLYFYSIILIGASKWFPYSLIKIEGVEDIYIPNILGSDYNEDNFWILCEKMNLFINNLSEKDIVLSKLIDNNLNKIDFEKLHRSIISISFNNDVNFLCLNNSNLSFEKIITLNDSGSKLFNFNINIYIIDNLINICLNSNIKSQTINFFFSYIINIIKSFENSNI